MIDIVGRVARGERPPLRPTLDVDSSIDVPPELVSGEKCDELESARISDQHDSFVLERDGECRRTALKPHVMRVQISERPKIDSVKKFLASPLFKHMSVNIMDHVFSIMETNAADLELEVHQRRVELQTEQKRAGKSLIVCARRRRTPQKSCGKLEIWAC